MGKKQERRVYLVDMFVDLTQFGQRLKVSGSPFKQLELAGDMGSAVSSALVTPSCFLVRGDNENISSSLPVGQRINRNTVIALTVHDLYGSRLKQDTAVDQRRRWMINRLHDWMPDANDQQTVGAVSYRRGRLHQMQDVQIWYADIFECEVRY